MTEPHSPQPSKPPSKWRRIAWFVGFWAVSVVFIYTLSQIIRWAIVP
ncbi:MAG: hypothetical protein NWS57_05005 [Burkholderiaceae bacterium]|nr:hypothetical protein [Burkholderiaceae bacterium]